MTFREALDELEHGLERVNGALDAGEEPQVPTFGGQNLSGTVTTEDVERYERLMAEMVACETRLQLERVKVLEELSGIGRRRSAVHAYAAHV